MRSIYKIIALITLINSGFVLNAKSNSLDIVKVGKGNNATNVVLPTATISGDATVCQNATEPQITFIGAGGTAPYTFTYNINGGSDLIVQTISGNSVLVNVPTGIAGIFKYTLVSVTDSSGTQLQSESATVTVNTLPTITGVFHTCIGSTSSLIGSGGAGSWTSSNPSVATINNAGLVTGVFLGTTNITYTNTNGCQKTTAFTVDQIPVVDFTSNATSSTCSGSSISFTSNVITGTPPYTYAWDFGDGSSSIIANPIHSLISLGCGTGNVTVKLTVTDANGCSSTQVSHTLTIKQKPDISFSDLNNPLAIDPFNNCSNAATNPVFTIKVGNTSPSPTCVSSYTIDWGDGSAVTTNANFPANHTYNLIGAYNMVISALGTNGCSNSSNFVIKNVTNPSGGIVSPGSTQNLCTPTAPLNFTISNWGSNSFGTVYDIDYGDGSAIVHLTQADLQRSSYYNTLNPLASQNFPIPYSYTTSNCPNPKYTALLTVSNACGETPSSVSNITVYSKPTAGFTVPSRACLNTNVAFTNTTLTGYNQSCVQNALYQWDFGDGTISTLKNPTHTYTTAGSYDITLIAQGYCGFSDPIKKTICVEAPLVPQFTLNTTEGCSPVAVTTTNTTDISGSCSHIYSWNVTYQSGYCGTTPSYTLLNGTTLTSFEPQFNFINPGTYSITLTATNSCSPQTLTKTVIVKQPPTISSIDGILANYCGPTNLNPTATVNSCAPVSSILTYAWSFPGGTPATSNLAIPGPISYATAGNYTVSLIVSSNDCGPSATMTKSFTINEVPVLTNTPLTQTVCSGLPSTLVNLTSNLTGTTFTWIATATADVSGFAPYGTSATIPVKTISTTNTSPGTVTYSITPSKGGCLGPVVNYVITVNPAPTITQPTSSSVCIGGTPITLSVTVSNVSSVPTYQWYSNLINSNSGGTAISGEINSTYSPPATTVGTTYYYCNITLSSGGCSNITSNTATVTITPLATISTQPTPNQSVCIGATVAPLTVGYTGGSGTVTYQWYSNTTNTNTGGTPISGAINASFTPPVFNTAGTFFYYAEIIFSGNGCGSIKSDPAEIIVVAAPTITQQPLASQILCHGASPADLAVIVTGGIGNSYSYQWFSNSSNSNSGGNSILGETNTNFTPPTTAVGTVYYYCFISQTGLNCSVTSTTAEVIVNTAPTFLTQPQSSTVCLGNSLTLLSVSYNNGVGTPQYQWYSNTTNSTLGSNAISGATSSSFNPPATSVGTIYYYIITLPTGGCSRLTSNIAAVTVNQNPVIANKNAVICSGNTFTITPDNLSGDIVPVGSTYTWSNPVISPTGSMTGALAQSTSQNNIIQTLTNTTTSPAKVTYTVTPQSGICAGANFTIVVTVNPSISPNITSNNSSCFGANNGAIQTNITGGIPFGSGSPYLISWSGPNSFSSSASSISNLAPGDYTLSITDDGGCPFSKMYTITEPDDIVITTDSTKNVTCFGNANGLIAITITGGTPNYTFAWTKNGAPYSTTKDLTNLGPGNYVVTVSDVNNCGPKAATFAIKEPPILAVNFLEKTNILCFGDATGAINVEVKGGVTPYTFAWTGPNGFTSSSQNLAAILAGNYNLKVTDNSGCSVNLSTVTITQTPEIIITPTTTPIICYGGNDASIRIAISGGISPYQITWSNLGSGTFQNNLSSGNYLITVTDALKCVKKLNVNIPDPPIFTINPVVKNISCFGANNGSINLNIVGGIAPVKLVWNDNAVAGNVRNNLGPGTYTVTITDGKPCTITRTFIILEPQALVLSAVVTNAFDCVNANSGAINLQVSGGTAPFIYAWSNGATTEDLSNIPAGNYLVTVTDKNGCSKQAQYSINRPPPIVVGVVTKTDFDCATKYVKQTFVAQVSGGMPPYQLAWSSGTVSGTNNELMNTNQNGTVILNVTDKLGCPANYTFNVKIPTLGSPSFNISSYAFSTFGIYSVKDPIQFTNTATGDFIGMSWDFGDGSVSIETNPIHTFLKEGSQVVIQTVTYPFGCVYTNTMTIKIEKGYELISPNAFTPNGDGINETFKPAFKGLKSIYLSIYDTWGELIYSENGDVLRGWDGKIKGKDAENGNFYYKVRGLTFYGEVINESNPFVLIK